MKNAREAHTLGKGLPDLLSLVLVTNNQRVEVFAGPDLELCDLAVLLHGHMLGVLAARNLEKMLKVGDLARLAAKKREVSIMSMAEIQHYSKNFKKGPNLKIPS